MKQVSSQESNLLLAELGLDPNDYRVVFFSDPLDAIYSVHLHVIARVALQTGKMDVLYFGNPISDSLDLLDGFQMEYLPLSVDEQLQVTEQSFSNLSSVRTATVSMSMVDRKVGSIQNLDLLQDLTHSNGILLHVDITDGLEDLLHVQDFSRIDWITCSFETGSMVILPKSASFQPARPSLTSYATASLDQKIGDAKAQYMERATLKQNLKQKIDSRPGIEVVAEPRVSSRYLILRVEQIHQDLISSFLEKRGHKVRPVEVERLSKEAKLNPYELIQLDLSETFDLDQFEKDLIAGYETLYDLTADLKLEGAAHG